MLVSSITTRLLDSFDDPIIAPSRWQALLREGETDEVFLTWQWQRAWWDTFSSDKLLLIAVERDGRLVALAPLYADRGMVYFIGSGAGADYLDFVGELADPETVEAILATARDAVPGFLGFRFYHVPDWSRTGERLRHAAGPLGLDCATELEMESPALDFSAGSDVGLAAARKKSLLRHEAYFRRHGDLKIQHFCRCDDILPQLSEFFEQHIARWSATRHPSAFRKPLRREFYERLTRRFGPTGWLRFTRIEWDGRPIAFHFGFLYRGSFLWFKPSFAIDLARRSPGEVLLRQLLLAAMQENASRFDFGLGDESFKLRFATQVRRVRTWGLYPSRPSRDRTTRGDPK